MMPASIRPIMRDGQEYYVLYVHRTTSDELHVIQAGNEAYEQAMDAGRNWRRAKREMNKAEASVRRALRKH